jgi:D-glycero-D-manno-heptose 1,7-bisphosphate phosphatase
MTLGGTQKALFLDRDGIINEDYGYVSTIEEFKFIDGIFELLHFFIQKNYTLFIVTNQSGIGRGYYESSDFEKLSTWMLAEFKKQNIHIESVHHCHHAPEENCFCRKPAIGMVDAILFEHNIDLEKSWLIGDKQSDINLAHNAHIAHTIAIGSRMIENSEYRFSTIMECKTFLEENQDTIL